jgi:CBS domain-containing protein
MLRVEDVMETGIVAVRGETTLKEAYALMRQYDIDSFPVVDKEYQLEGMAYAYHILQALYRESKHYFEADDIVEAVKLTNRILISSIMIRSPRVTTPYSDVIQLGYEMLDQKIESMPVVNGGKLVGMIYSSKVFMALMNVFLDRDLTEKFIKETGERKDIRSSTVLINEYSGSERRQHKRVHTKMLTAYKIANSEGFVKKGGGRLASAIDIGAGGILLKTEEELNVGTLLDIAFDLFGKNEPIKRLGRVVRCVFNEVARTYLVGIMFLAMSTEERAIVEKFVASRLK